MLAPYIYEIAKLPARYSIILDTADQQEVLQVQQFRYQAYSLFLRWIRLGESPADELFITTMKHYEPFAKFWDSILTLAIEVYPRSADEEIRSFKSPAELWFVCLKYQSQKAAEGMLEGNLERKAKEKSILKGLELCRYLDNLKTPCEGPMPDCIITRLILEAREIAGREREFDKRAYRPFVKALRKVFNYAKRFDALQFGWIEINGQLFITGQSKKLPKLLEMYKK